jgi:hypothetical protein
LIEVRTGIYCSSDHWRTSSIVGGFGSNCSTTSSSLSG